VGFLVLASHLVADVYHFDQLFEYAVELESGVLDDLLVLQFTSILDLFHQHLVVHGLLQFGSQPVEVQLHLRDFAHSLELNLFFSANPGFFVMNFKLVFLQSFFEFRNFVLKSFEQIFAFDLEEDSWIVSE